MDLLELETLGSYQPIKYAQKPPGDQWSGKFLGIVGQDQ